MADPPVAWWIGPPPPLAITRLTRALQLAALSAMLVWVLGYLGGLRLSPQPTAPDGSANDTSQLFNWHPLLITLAFPVLMAEAVLAYKAPLVALSDRWGGASQGRVRAAARACQVAAWRAETNLQPSSGCSQAGQDTGMHDLRVPPALPLPVTLPSPRPHAKLYHLVLHTLALVCTVLGVVAAFKSHTLKKPTPMADL